MPQHLSTELAPTCPSAQPEMSGASVFGIIQGSPSEPRVAYLERTVAMTPEVASLAAPVEPTEVFRIGAPCAGGGCVHFGEGRCRLAERLVQALPVVSAAPPCAIRGTCMWWRQESIAACMRCPQIVTRMYGATETLQEAATPPSSFKRQ